MFWVIGDEIVQLGRAIGATVDYHVAHATPMSQTVPAHSPGVIEAICTVCVYVRTNHRRCAAERAAGDGKFAAADR